MNIFEEEIYYRNEIIEESIRNNSASSRLKSLINKAESQGKNKDASKVLSTLRSGYQDFLKLENAYKNASTSAEKSKLKQEYKDLKQKYSYQLKKIHLPKGAAAALLGAALTIVGGAEYTNHRNSTSSSTPVSTGTVREYKSHEEEMWEKRKAEMEAKNEAFRNREKKSDETFYRSNVMGYAKKLYKGGVINPDNRKSLDTYDFIDFKNQLMSAYNVDGYMTEANGKEFAKEYLKILEANAPRGHKVIMDLARRYMASPERQRYEKDMRNMGRY